MVRNHFPMNNELKERIAKLEHEFELLGESYEKGEIDEAVYNFESYGLELSIELLQKELKRNESKHQRRRKSKVL